MRFSNSWFSLDTFEVMADIRMLINFLSNLGSRNFLGHGGQATFCQTSKDNDLIDCNALSSPTKLEREIVKIFLTYR